ncbi:MAG: hydroxymethylbilane synthase [Desulfovibrionaceae bacterium]|nr:hydroxymethylbilane synthase [Desulfovibrionaceae bacterium]
MARLVIATRGSRLALWQAEHIRARILERLPDLRVELLILKTRGDVIQDVPLAKVGGKGLFVKEIEEALLDGRADFAVHSIKDLPVDLPLGLTLGVIPPREAQEDILLSVDYPGLEALPAGAKVGTSSLRRQAQLLALRPDLQVSGLRGNVDTRLKKLLQGEFAAIILAQAGLRRLGLSAPQEQILNPEHFLPAVGQGALGLEYSLDNQDLAQKLAFMDHAPTRRQVEGERAFLAELEGGCQTPIAACARLEDALLTLDGLVATPDGRRIIRRRIQGSASQAVGLGQSLAKEIKAAGGTEILQSLTQAC